MTLKTTSTQDLIDKDSILGEIIDIVDILPSFQPNPIFHDLIACILEQQIPYRSTKKTFEKLLLRAGISILTPDNFEQFERDGLATVKLTANKIETLQHVVDSWSLLPKNWEQLSDTEVRSTFKQVKGIGPWTVDMLLLYTLQRDNIFPADDYHLKQIMSKLYGLDSKSKLKAQMKEVASVWEPHASKAVLYLLEWKRI